MAPLTSDPILTQDNPRLSAARRVWRAALTWRKHYASAIPLTSLQRLGISDEALDAAITMLIGMRRLRKVDGGWGACDLAIVSRRYWQQAA